MERRRFLMGMGAFAGAALIVPRAATIFDMGRDTGLAAPPLVTLTEIWAPGRTAFWISHKNESAPYQPGFRHTFSDGTYYEERGGSIWRAGPNRYLPGTSWSGIAGPSPAIIDTNPDPEYQRWLQDWTHSRAVPTSRTVEPSSVWPTWRNKQLTEVEVKP